MKNLATVYHKLFVARAEADENGAAGAPAVFNNTTAGDFASKPTTGVIDILDPPRLDPTTEIISPSVFAESNINGVIFSFTGGSAAGKTFTYDVFTWANENGPAKHSMNGTGIFGTQKVVKYPHNGAAATSKFWADTLVITWDNHPKETETTDETGHNSVSEIWFDTTGERYIMIQISDADGSTGTEAGDIACYFRYW